MWNCNANERFTMPRETCRNSFHMEITRLFLFDVFNFRNTEDSDWTLCGGRLCEGNMHQGRQSADWRNRQSKFQVDISTKNQQPNSQNKSND